MTKQVGKGFTIHITASVRAGFKTLEELCSQGHISTTDWLRIKVEPIDNNGNYSDARRVMTFTLGKGQRIEVQVTTWKKQLGDVVQEDEQRGWTSYIVYVEGKDRMKCLTNMVGAEPFHRQPESDKPLPGDKWRAPTDKEVAAYEVAVQDRDEEAFLKVYYIDLIDWEELNDKLGRSTAWVRKTLQKAA